MKYSAKQLKSGEWAVHAGSKYFTHSVTPDERAAKVEALKMSAIWHRNQMDTIHAELRDMGEVDPSDEYGYLA